MFLKFGFKDRFKHRSPVNFNGVYRNEGQMFTEGRTFKTILQLGQSHLQLQRPLTLEIMKF